MVRSVCQDDACPYPVLTALESGNWKDAEQLFKAALEADVTYAPAHNNLGRLYFQQRRYYLAAWEFEYAAGLMPDRAEPHNNLGLVYEAVGRLEEAVEQYNAANAAVPHDAEYIGNLARAELKLDPQNAMAQELLHELVYRDSRKEWVCWAREQLGLGSLSPDEAAQATDAGNSAPESLPLPTPAEMPPRVLRFPPLDE